MIHIEQKPEFKIFKGRVIFRHRYVVATASAATVVAFVATGATLRYPTQRNNSR